MRGLSSLEMVLWASILIMFNITVKDVRISNMRWTYMHDYGGLRKTRKSCRVCLSVCECEIVCVCVCVYVHTFSDSNFEWYGNIESLWIVIICPISNIKFKYFGLIPIIKQCSWLFIYTCWHHLLVWSEENIHRLIFQWP